MTVDLWRQDITSFWCCGSAIGRRIMLARVFATDTRILTRPESGVSPDYSAAWPTSASGSVGCTPGGYELLDLVACYVLGLLRSIFPIPLALSLAFMPSRSSRTTFFSVTYGHVNMNPFKSKLKYYSR